MNTVYLLRHAEAKSSRFYNDDHARELSKHGKRDARRLGRFLGTTDQVADQIVSSTAVRARRTAELLGEGGGEAADVPLRSTHALYQAEPVHVLEELRALASSIGSVLLVGHEPAWSAAVSRLVGSAQVSLSPGTCVRIDTERQWADLEFGDGILRWMVPPSLLRD